jgi:hypothetical protein
VGTKSKWKNGILRFYNDAVVEENVETLTTAGAMRGYGLSVINTTAAATFTMGAPVPGVVKDIAVGTIDASSWAATIRCSTVANSITVGSPSSDVQNGIVLTPGSTLPARAQLRGATTILWVLTSFSTGKGGAALTTACT